jgi:leader peptidase (prepilin peptidase) / N-methyltransferase
MLNSFAEIQSSFPWFFAGVFFVYGAVVGSFLNVCILRIPAGKSVVRPGSHCACGKPIAWYDNIPILSWLILRGKARCCGRSFSPRYAAIELLTGLLFASCWMLFPAAKALLGMLFVSALICATFIDLDTMEIPDVFTLGLGLVGLLASLCFPSLHGHSGDLFLIDSFKSAMDSLLGLLLGSGLVLWIALLSEYVLKKEAMGFGDVKFVGAIGAFTGWQGAVMSIFGGAIVGTLWFCIAFLYHKLFGAKGGSLLSAESPEGQPAELGFGVHVPFGPMLAIAALLHFLWAHRWFEAYIAQFSELLR